MQYNQIDIKYKWSTTSCFHFQASEQILICLLSSFSPAATLTDVMTLDNPVNGSSPAIRTDYTGHKAKGNTSPS